MTSQPVDKVALEREIYIARRQAEAGVNGLGSTTRMIISRQLAMWMCIEAGHNLDREVIGEYERSEVLDAVPRCIPFKDYADVHVYCSDVTTLIRAARKCK